MAHQDAVTLPLQIVDRLVDVDCITDEAVDGVIFKRSLPSFVRSALEVMPFDGSLESRFSLPPQLVGERVSRLLLQWGMQQGGAQAWLAEDIKGLAVQLTQLLSISHVCVRVEVVQDDACRKFHRDAIRARLICTYAGPGTEYGVSFAGREPHGVAAVPTGCPIILKGRSWPGLVSEPCLVHRSPPIEGLAMSRLVVVIDEASVDSC